MEKQKIKNTLAFIGLGSNLGDCRKNLLDAWARLGEVAGVKLLVISSPYQTEPVGMISENWFINAAGSIATSLEPEQLLAAMHGIEASLGRKRVINSVTPMDRQVDLDLLFWGSRIIDDPGLSLPHPQVDKRLFVLAPMAEIGPHHKHPVIGKTMTELLNILRNEQGEAPQVRRTTWQDNTKEQAS